MNKERYIFPFERLDVWNMAIDLAELVLSILEKLPYNRHIRLISQMEAAVTSIAQNIAEGKGRQHQKEFIQFLSISQGSLYEMITLSEVFRRGSLFSAEECALIAEAGEAIDRKLNGLMNSLREEEDMRMTEAEEEMTEVIGWGLEKTEATDDRVPWVEASASDIKPLASNLFLCLMPHTSNLEHRFRRTDD